MLRLVLLVSLLAASCTRPPPAPGPSSATRVRGGDAVVAARERLAAMIPEEHNTSMTPRVRAAVEALKDTIVGFVVAEVRAAPQAMGAAALQQRLRERGGARDDPRVSDADHYRPMHGAWLTYEVAQPAGQPPMLAVVAQFGLECGFDSLFFLFDRTGGAVRLVMLRRTPPYEDVSGAFASFGYAVSPPDRQGRWYVAFAQVPGWCTSNWRMLRVELARPGPRAIVQQVFFSRRFMTYLGNYGPAVPRAEPNRFQIEHDGGLLGAGFVRRHVETFSLSGDSVRRIQPVAFNVRDFVDEWIASPWYEARRWSSPARALEHAHRRFSHLSAGSSFEFGSVRGCAGGLSEVRVDDMNSDERWFFAVSGSGPFRLERAADTSLRGCDGPELLERIERESERRMRIQPAS